MASEAAAPVSEKDNKSKLVIAVDDSTENLALISSAVTPDGYSFVGISSPKECLGMMTRVTPRLILLDIQMPEMDGLELCRRLRSFRHLSGVPIVFLTARKTVEDVRTGMAAGGNDFIIKPFEQEKLQERVRYWTNRRIRSN
jgi:two-component system, OmpR family, response regulator